MRGGLERWKRGANSHGVHAAIAYALDGECDSGRRASRGVEALADYSDTASRTVTRFAVTNGTIATDELDRAGLTAWVDGCDPATGERRGRELLSPQADLVLDGTINAPKSFSIAAMVHPGLAAEFEALQDRLRDRVILTWQRELNARRGAGGRLRQPIHRLEVVELRHRRSRALDPHIHRHLWLNVKVQGVDGGWSNVDSRVAMRLHTLINAEGELAARTDPRWLSALADHGYTLNADEEIAELAHVVRPMSRRSNQIEANRAGMLATWRAEHRGAEPDREVLARIDRAAWAKGRPHKPANLDETAWQDLVLSELTAIDPEILAPRSPVAFQEATAHRDVGRLAASALVDADRRSAANGGRFSMIDLRAGATRAVATSGTIADRDELQPLIDAVVARAASDVVDLLEGEVDRPAHVKGFMATTTAALKLEVAGRFDDLTQPGQPVRREHVAIAAAAVLGDVPLDTDQGDAAAAIGGTDRLVTVTGPAGTGKTTILRVAKRLLDAQHRRIVVVAPTKKAASVAAREVGATGSSLHALLADHGFRWQADDTGSDIWTRFRPGQTDPTGRVYPGPSRFPLAAGDRIVIDEAGMVDLHTARALAVLAAETGAGLAMVGDHLQALPVGHAGAMTCMARRSTAVVELSAIHRFRDPAYAALTVRMREPDGRANAVSVAADLDAGGHVRVAADSTAARTLMVDGYIAASARGQRIALVTASNEEADAVNELIQQHRLDDGQLTLTRIGTGIGEQRILEGDIVQTRRNDTTAGVDNRALWVVRRIHHDSFQLASVSDSAEIRTVSADYAADHLHLAYASTVHGIQGETTDAAIVGPGVDAAGLYVGMTRGRSHNEAIVILKPHQNAIDELADTMMRGLPEVTLEDARRAAAAELSRAARAPVTTDFAEQLAELARVDEWLAAARTAIHSAYTDHANADAHGHGRALAVDPLGDDIARLADLFADRTDIAASLRGALLVAAPTCTDTTPVQLAYDPSPSDLGEEGPVR